MNKIFARNQKPVPMIPRVSACRSFPKTSLNTHRVSTFAQKNLAVRN